MGGWGKGGSKPYRHGRDAGLAGRARRGAPLSRHPLLQGPRACGSRPAQIGDASAAAPPAAGMAPAAAASGWRQATAHVKVHSFSRRGAGPRICRRAARGPSCHRHRHVNDNTQRRPYGGPPRDAAARRPPPPPTVANAYARTSRGPNSRDVSSKRRVSRPLRYLSCRRVKLKVDRTSSLRWARRGWISVLNRLTLGRNTT